MEPRWFGPFTVAEHDPDTDNYNLTLPRRMDRQKPFFHVSSLKEYCENDPDRFASRRMDNPAPILIYNAEDWEVEDILDYRLQNNRHEFLVHWKGYERVDDSWEPIENLVHSLELIQEYWNTNHPTQPTPKITSHYVKAVWEPKEVLVFVTGPPGPYKTQAPGEIPRPGPFTSLRRGVFFPFSSPRPRPRPHPGHAPDRPP